MTLLVIWTSLDSHGPSAIYIASDSRITWGKADSWDYAQKVFASVNFPEVFGFCGDVLFPTQVLSRITSMIDHGQVLTAEMDCSEKFELVRKLIADALEHYPRARILPEFTIVHCSREKDTSFKCNTLTWNANSDLTEKSLDPSTGDNKRSHVMGAFGSGRGDFLQAIKLQDGTVLEGTSRGIYAVVVEKIQSQGDIYVGGVPQLVGIYRGAGKGKVFGIEVSGNRYVLGLESNSLPRSNSFEWRNQYFERSDGFSRLSSAQPQPPPRPPIDFTAKTQ